MDTPGLHRFLPIVALLGVGAAALWLWAPRQEARLAHDESVVVFARSSDALVPLPLVPDLPAGKVALGKALFQDVRFSHDNTLSCASCHDLNSAGHDPRRFSIGVGGALGGINAPSVFNASLNFVQFWDGRARNLEEQAAGPVHNPIELASNWDEVVGKLRADEAVRREFQHIYPDGVTADNVVDAIVTFERTLLTSNAPFDRFLRGDQQAIDAKAIAGYRRFREFGCTSCHQGANIGGNMFQRFGVMADYFADRASSVPATEADLGRYNVTRREEDRHVFKVPSLRNVALTAPYFHNGSVATLDEAVSVMGRYQLGRRLSKDEVASIVVFLNTLTGERPASLRDHDH
jgi:cytochrome c peroxidase